MKKRDTVNERFIQCMHRLIEDGVYRNITHFATEMGTYPTIIKAIERGKRNATVDMIIQMSRHHKVSPNYLFNFKDEFIDSIIQAYASQTTSLVYSKSTNAAKIHDFFGKTTVFMICGKSMEPTLNDGDLLICKRLESSNQIIDKAIYVVVSNDGINVKRVEVVKEGNHVSALRLISDNEIDNPPFDLNFQADLNGYPNIQIYLPKKRITETGIKI